MDLIEITYHDYLADCAEGISFDNWFLYDWENYVLRHCDDYDLHDKKKPLSVRDINFSLGDDHIELYDNVYDTEPHTDIVPPVEGRLTTLYMITTIKIKNGKIKGKMCIRNKSHAPLYTEYELCLEDAVMKVLVGLAIDNKGDYDGDAFEFNHCICTCPTANLSFSYSLNSKPVQVFDSITDISKKTLLKQFMLEYFTKNVSAAVISFEKLRLSYKTGVSDQTGQDYTLRNVLKIHNRVLHTAFNNLAKEIIRLTNALIQEKSVKIQLSKLFGILSLPPNKEKKLKIYHGFINNLNSLKMIDDKYAIVSKKGELVIVHVPVEFEKLDLNYKEINKDQPMQGASDIFKVQSYTTEEAYFVMSLKKLDTKKAELNLLDFKIINFKSTSESQINITMDYLVSNAIEEIIKSCVTNVFETESLDDLAINPDVEIQYYGNEFNVEAEDESESSDG